MSRLRTTLLALVACAAALGPVASSHAVAPPPRLSVGQRLGLGGRAAPLGLVLESESTLRWRFGPDGSFLFEDAHLDVGVAAWATPAQLAVGGLVELQPAAFLVLRARALHLGWLGTFGTLHDFAALDADWSPDALAALEDADAGHAAGGWQVDLEAQVRLAVGDLALLAAVRPTWLHVDTRGPTYEPWHDLLVAADDRILIANALLGWCFGRDAIVGLRWDLVVGEAAADATGPRHTLGALGHWVAVAADGGAPELAIDALVGVYLADPYRAGAPFVAAGATLAWRLTP